MGYANYKQYDSRWGKLNYNGSSDMATAGCGPTSVANLAYAVDGKTTPIHTMRFMQKNGYAVYNNGTAWAGIPACEKAFGLINVKNESDMSDVWTRLSRGCCAVFLMRAGTKGGITWTSSGHYISVTNYYKKDGKHYVYTRDSGGRGNTGWFCYETQMAGLIPQIWVAKVPPKKTNGDKLFDMAMKCAWKADKTEDKWGFPEGKAKKAYKNLLEKIFPYHDKWKYQIRSGASCAVFVATIIRATVDSKFPCKNPVDQLTYMKHSSKWKKVSWAKAKPGDVIVYVSSKGSAGHIMIYKTKSYLIEASYAKAYPHVKKVPKKFKSKEGRKKYHKFAVYRKV